MVVYHLQGETGQCTVFANGKQEAPNGKLRLRLARTVCAVSGTTTTTTTSFICMTMTKYYSIAKAT